MPATQEEALEELEKEVANATTLLEENAGFVDGNTNDQLAMAIEAAWNVIDSYKKNHNSVTLDEMNEVLVALKEAMDAYMNNVTTGINTVANNSQAEQEEAYTLSGQKVRIVKNGQRKNIYIVNGKKVLR